MLLKEIFKAVFVVIRFGETLLNLGGQIIHLGEKSGRRLKDQYYYYRIKTTCFNSVDQ